MMDEIVKAVADMLGDGYEVKVVKIDKGHGENRGISIRPDGEGIATVNYVEDLQKEYQDPQKIAEVLVRGYREVVRRDLPTLGNELFALTRETLLKNVSVRMVKASGNEDFLRDKPHRRILDMAAIYVYNFDNNEFVATITDSMAEGKSVSEEDLYKAASKNARDIGLNIRSIDDAVTDFRGAELLTGADDQMSKVLVCTSKSEWQGASIIAFPDQMDIIANILEGPFYVIPASVHFILALPVGMGINPMALRGIVEMINATTDDVGNNLTNHIYCYNTDDRSLSIVA